MPWKGEMPITARRDGVDDRLRGLSTMAGFCPHYGISRHVGYRWGARFGQLTPNLDVTRDQAPSK